MGTISFSNNQWLWEPSVSQTMLKNLSYKEVEILTLNLREFKFLWENLNISLGERAASWLIFLCETLALKQTNKLITAFRNICTEEPAAGLENKKTNKQTKKICARMPVYRVLFRSKFSTVSGHMIKCLLTEFCWAGRENIRLSVTKQGPRCAPTTWSISTKYFGLHVTLLSFMM